MPIKHHWQPADADRFSNPQKEVPAQYQLSAVLLFTHVDLGALTLEFFYF
jgi:hypothetical protein